MNLKLINEDNINFSTNNDKIKFNNEFDAINLKEPSIQPKPNIISKNKNINLINYDEFSIKENNSNNTKINTNDIHLKNSKGDIDEINNILNLNNKTNDLKEINYNHNNYAYIKSNNKKEFINLNNKNQKEKIDINDIGKIIEKNIN